MLLKGCISMTKINRSIEIVRAKDVHFSSMGIKSGMMIKEVLSKYYQKVSLCAVGSIGDLENLVNRQPDLAILGVKRIRDKDEYIWLSEYLDKNGINYSGSSKNAMELDLNKADAKLLMQSNLIPTAKFFTARPGEFTNTRQLPIDFPVFIKPHNQGGGVGIGPDSIARDYVSFKNKVQSIYDKYGGYSLVEAYLVGGEFTVGLMGSGYEAQLSVMPLEIITKPNDMGDKILGSAVKKEDNERAIKITDIAVKKQVSKLAQDAYRVLGARDYGRIDIRMDSNGVANFIEANLTPGIAHNDFISYFTHACNINLQMDYESMILRIVELGLARVNMTNCDKYIPLIEDDSYARHINPSLYPI